MSRPLRNTLQNESSLKNLLITVKDMTIRPTPPETKNPKDVTIDTTNRDRWDVTMTLQFYIRGVSRDHIAALDTSLTTLLDQKNREGSLIARSQELLKICNNCPEATQIKDIITLLGNAKTAYDSIIAQEKKAKNTMNPIETLERRTRLMSTIETLQKKLDALSSKIAPIQ